MRNELAAKLDCSKRVRKASKQGRSTSAKKRLKLERCGRLLRPNKAMRAVSKGATRSKLLRQGTHSRCAFRGKTRIMLGFTACPCARSPRYLRQGPIGALPHDPTSAFLNSRHPAVPLTTAGQRAW